MAQHPKDPRPQGERTVSLHEGTDSRQVPWLLTPNQAVHIENLEVDKLGVRSRRRGAKSFGGEAGVPMGIASYNEADFDEFLISFWGDKIYKSAGNGGWAQVASNASNVSGLLMQTMRARHNGELGIAYCTCERPTEASLGIGGRSYLGVYSIESDDDTAASLAPRTIASFQNRLFYGESETIGWSEIGDLAAFSDTNNILIEPGVGGEITAILPSREVEPKMTIFKEKAIFVFAPRWGTDGGFIAVAAADALDTINSSVRLLTNGTGCIATKTVQPVPDAEGADVFFLAPDGVRSLNRADNDVAIGAGFPITYNIPGYIDRINWDAAHRAVATVFDNAYHLAVPLDGSNDNSHVLRYDIRNKAWSLSTWEARDLGTFRLGGTDRLFMQNRFTSSDSSVTDIAGDAVYQVYQCYSGDHDPSTDATNVSRIIPREESRSFTFGDPLVKKTFDRFSVQLSAGATCAYEVAYRRDTGSWATMTESTIGGSGGTILFGTDPLPWLSSEEVMRKRTFGLADLIAPAYGVQFRLGGVTGTTESGRISYYFSETTGEMSSDAFENDE